MNEKVRPAYSLTLPLALFQMVRPAQLLSILLVYLLGGLAAQAQGGALLWQRFMWGWLPLLAISLSIHYINEYADYETDRLTQRTAFSGGSGALPAGLAPRRTALIAAWLTLILGLMLAGAAFLAGQLTAWAGAVLALGAFGGWMYSVRPLQLAWRGWGELDNALLGGMLLPLYGYLIHGGTLTFKPLLIFLPFTLLVFANLLATTWADREADAQVGKYTLATFVPAERLRLLYGMIMLLALAAQSGLALCGFAPIALLTPLPAVAFMAWGLLTYTRLRSPHPSVLLMIVFLLAQMLGWFLALAPL